MSSVMLVTANDVDPDRLNSFLKRVYSTEKSAFLHKYGAWWHGSNTNRLVLLVDGQIAGYCALISAHIWVAGQVKPALWWVDLVIAPEFRGRGLQTLFDERVRAMSDGLLLGFPNELAIKIHRKHGWGVREDLKVVLLPLRPQKVKTLLSAHGWRGWVLRLGAFALSPLAALWRAWLTFPSIRRAWKLEQFDAELLAEISQRVPREKLNTTWRDIAYFNWRYGQAPKQEEYSYYLAGERSMPTHFLVARQIRRPDGVSYMRFLDVFGNFSDVDALRDLLLLACQDAIKKGCSQVTLMAAHPELANLARNLGFIFSSKTGFCWMSSDPLVTAVLNDNNYWSLADSDNDAPD